MLLVQFDEATISKHEGATEAFGNCIHFLVYFLFFLADKKIILLYQSTTPVSPIEVSYPLTLCFTGAQKRLKNTGTPLSYMTIIYIHSYNLSYNYHSYFQIEKWLSKYLDE